MQVKKKAKSVSSTSTKSARGRTAKVNTAKFSKEDLAALITHLIFKKDKTIISLVKNSLYHYEMLMALQTQVVCLEAKIKILEERLRRLV